jgi:CRISPR-associated endonuclease/helicase Cas3
MTERGRLFFAHSGQLPDRSDWELLPVHLREVAELAGGYGEALGLAPLCRLASLLHDLGKYNPQFQRRLDGADIAVDHSTAGAAEVLRRVTGAERMFGELAAYAIAGHHAGLPDRRGMTGGSLAERVARFDPATLDPVWRTELNLVPEPLTPPFAWGWAGPDVAFGCALTGRMLFSALVDADFKATERFYEGLEGRKPDRDWPALSERLDGLIGALDRRLAALGGRSGPVMADRARILAQVRSRAAEAPGLFTLTVPTGGGKTLTSLAFALDHARRHGKRRIIYAIPFTAIIEQTARQFREILGDDVVLEHHSAIEPDSGANGRADSDFGQKDKLRLAMEDWAAPLVVTTNVQLFESLFAARTSRARKLHNIAQSVIVLDEAQTLPRPLLLPVLRMLEALARDYGCTVVLCTATQPALDARHLPGGLPLAGRELAPDPSELVQRFRRVTLRDAGPLGDGALVEDLASVPQGLVIVNSRRHALALYDAGRAAGLDGLTHLSTRMCAAHRRPLLDTIRDDLRQGRPCRVISTSLIEAGVDVDFPRVWRAEAGLDSVAQAAGRCNREGTRPPEESIVTLFEAPDYGLPPELRQLSDARKRMQHKFPDLFSPEAMTEYFREVYWRLGTDRLDCKGILPLFALDSGGTEFAYRTAAERFRMIESGMVPVIVPYDDRARAAIAQLGVPALSSGRLARDLQHYTVDVPPRARARLVASGRAAFVAPDLRADQFCVLSDLSLYREDVGLVWEDADYLGVEALVLT